MLNVIHYLKNALVSTPEDALSELEKDFGIKNSYNEEYCLWVLNYDQIKSAKYKFNPIVRECRSLVVAFDEYEGFYVVSRSFDRFFNHGEEEINTHHSNIRAAVEKMDGSLITIFWHKGAWLYRTKSMIMPTSSIQGFDTTRRDIIEPHLPKDGFTVPKCFNYWGEEDLLGLSFICEVMSPENRVVVRYDKPKFSLLSIRDNQGYYFSKSFCDDFAEHYGWSRPKEIDFDTIEEILYEAKNLENLEEGFVLYDWDDNPVLKIKNPAYVAAHLRGEGVLNSKRVCDLIIMGEVDEYLSVFPEDDQIIAPYVEAYDKFLVACNSMWELYASIEDQKKFALTVKDHPTASLLFSMRKGFTFDEAWSKLTENAKRQMIMNYLVED